MCIIVTKTRQAIELFDASLVEPAFNKYYYSANTYHTD